MANIHLMCIGGSGLRVLRSFIMLLASGYDVRDNIVYPYLIDPHSSSIEIGDVANLIQKYSVVSGCQSTNFFHTKIQAMANGNSIMAPLYANTPFANYLGQNKYGNLSPERMLINMLYSDSNLTNKLEVGFKGSPNVGSVVFNDFINNQNNSLKQNFTNIQSNQDVFILIGSLFGGTGASGLTTLAQSIRQQVGKNAKIAVIALMPYYRLGAPKQDSQDNHIHSDYFDIKTYKALEMCQQNNNQYGVDSYYLVGDSVVHSSYPYDEQKQGNPAHIVELIAATAIRDFSLKFAQNQPLQLWNRFIVPAQSGTTLTKDTLAPLDYEFHTIANFYTFCKFHKMMSDSKYSRYPFYNHFKDSLLSDSSYQTLKAFMSDFIDWFGELYYNSGHRLEAFTADFDEKTKAFVPKVQHPLFQQSDQPKRYYDMSEYFVKINSLYNRRKGGTNLKTMLDTAYSAINELVSEF